MCRNHSHIAVALVDAYTDAAGNRRLEFSSTLRTTLELEDGSRLTLKPGATFVLWLLKQDKVSWSETPPMAGLDTLELQSDLETSFQSGRIKVIISPVG